LDHDLTSLQRDLGSGSRLKLSEQTKSLTEVLGDASSLGLVGSVLLKNGKDERALGADTAVRQNSVDDLHDIILVLVTELQDDSVLLGLVHEEVLDLPVLLQKSLDNVKLSALLALGVHLNDLGQGSEGALEKVGITSVDVVLEELVESLAESLGREVGVARLAALNDLGELGIKLLGHARVEGRELSVPLAVGKLSVAEDLDELLQGVGHDDRVVVT
jgi:hypothetical protein